MSLAIALSPQENVFYGYARADPFTTHTGYHRVSPDNSGAVSLLQTASLRVLILLRIHSNFLRDDDFSGLLLFPFPFRPRQPPLRSVDPDRDGAWALGSFRYIGD